MNIIEEKQKKYDELILQWKKIKRGLNLALIPVGVSVVIAGICGLFGSVAVAVGFIIASPSYWFLWLIVRLVFSIIVVSDIEKSKRELDSLKIQLFPTQYVQQTIKQEQTQYTKCAYCGYETPVQFKKCSHCGAVL